MDDAEGAIVNLSQTNHNKIIFCIHPIGGNVNFYHSLSQLLKDNFSVYGIKSPKLNPGSSGIESIEAIAQLYNSYIIDLVKNRPFVLLGWSMGGIIAFEMARQLAIKGLWPQCVILIDTYEPACLPSFNKMDLNEFNYHLLHMLLAGTKNVDQKATKWYIKLLLKILIALHVPFSLLNSIVSAIGLKNFKENLLILKKNLSSPHAPLTPMDEWLAFAREKKLIPNNLSNDEILSYYQAIRTHIHAYENYQCHYYDGNLFLLKSRYGYKGKQNESQWRLYCKSINEYFVNTNHYDIITNKTALKLIQKKLGES